MNIFTITKSEELEGVSMHTLMRVKNFPGKPLKITLITDQTSEEKKLSRFGGNANYINGTIKLNSKTEWDKAANKSKRLK